MEYLLVKWIHILSSTLLFGTGLGSAFYMYFASRTRDARVIAAVVKHVVIADWAFTAPTVVLQPLSGFYLLHLLGYPLTTRWITWSLALFLLAGAAWLPVVWMQLRMRDMAAAAAGANAELPATYWRYLRIWIALGIVAFVSLVAVFYLMVAKPA
ncbi:MAG TPA: DUF2269 domain-containing protein [Burkholderiales bacterium]|nr:DUF2269 domain-containing protein [Burkholderiales bacterium]